MTDSRDLTWRRGIELRLTEEFGDPGTAAEIVAALPVGVVEDLARRSGGDFSTSPLLSYRPPTIADEEIDTLWVLAFGYRLAAGVDDDGAIPPMADVEPGPVNAALAREALSIVARHSVPIVAQWEVARVLNDLGATDVVTVEPDQAPDGSVVYLSTAGVIDKGLSLAVDAGLEVGQVGVLGHADHASRCVMTATNAGTSAAVPSSARLPAEYDPHSGQPWTRSRVAFVPMDLMARSMVA